MSFLELFFLGRKCKFSPFWHCFFTDHYCEVLLAQMGRIFEGCYTDHFPVCSVLSVPSISSLRLSDFSKYIRCEHLEPPSLFVLFCPTCITGCGIHLDLSFTSIQHPNGTIPSFPHLHCTSVLGLTECWCLDSEQSAAALAEEPETSNSYLFLKSLYLYRGLCLLSLHPWANQAWPLFHTVEYTVYH